jgi:hypothetical protein
MDEGRKLTVQSNKHIPAMQAAGMLIENTYLRKFVIAFSQETREKG